MLKNKIVKLLKIVQDLILIKILLTYKVAASVEHSQVLKHLQAQKFQAIVDIGANCGQFALIARKYFPDAMIVSFEPLKEPSSLFRRVFLDDSRVILHEIAIGPEEKQMTIHVSNADDSSSLLPISALQSSLFPGTTEKEERIVQVKPLDAILNASEIEKPALLKMDVQGFEKEALDGCKSLLSSFSYVYVECSFVELYAGQALAHEVISFLDGLGFILSGIYNPYYDKKGIAIQADFLFQRKNLTT
jgi:FkbM family methyltransferase